MFLIVFLAFTWNVIDKELHINTNYRTSGFSNIYSDTRNIQILFTSYNVTNLNSIKYDFLKISKFIILTRY